MQLVTGSQAHAGTPQIMASPALAQSASVTQLEGARWQAPQPSDSSGATQRALMQSASPRQVWAQATAGQGMSSPGPAQPDPGGNPFHLPRYLLRGNGVDARIKSGHDGETLIFVSACVAPAPYPSPKGDWA